MLQKILANIIRWFDSLYNNLYPNDKNDLIKSILNDHSEIDIDLNDFVKTRGTGALREIYVIMNNFYISKLSELIVEGNDSEISKLKYLQVILVDIKNTLNINSSEND